MIGHALPAAGIASLIKTTLMLSNKILAPSLHCEDPHPDLDGAPFYVNPACRTWIHSPKHHPRRAGVNAFGFGGINCHVVLEEVPETNSVAAAPLGPRPIVINLERESELCLFSGPSRADIVLSLEKLRHFLECDQSDYRLQDIAYTLADQADLNQPCKLALIAKNTGQLSDLTALCTERLSAADELPASGVEDRETIYYSDSALRSMVCWRSLFRRWDFRPGCSATIPTGCCNCACIFPICGGSTTFSTSATNIPTTRFRPAPCWCRHRPFLQAKNGNCGHGSPRKSWCPKARICRCKRRASAIFPPSA